jgi:hypothetical protein
MRKTFISIIICGIAVVTVSGQTIPEKDAAMIDELINSTISIKKVIIESGELAKVFNGTFYRAIPTYNHRGGIASCEEYGVVVHNGKVTELEDVSETKTLDFLFSLLKKDFTIRNESEAKIFEAALDAIYPIDWTVDAEDKKVFQQDGKWLFLRGSFFESVKGFVVTLDQSFGISQIDFDLEAVKGE